MRHILHQIFERYLNSRQPEFDTSIRELWPTERFAPHAFAVISIPRLPGSRTTSH
jgi:hypothetical protein